MKLALSVVVDMPRHLQLHAHKQVVHKVNRHLLATLTNYQAPHLIRLGEEVKVLLQPLVLLQSLKQLELGQEYLYCAAIAKPLSFRTQILERHLLLQMQIGFLGHLLVQMVLPT